MGGGYKHLFIFIAAFVCCTASPLVCAVMNLLCSLKDGADNLNNFFCKTEWDDLPMGHQILATVS